MNNATRKLIASLASELNELRGKFEDITAQLETLRDDEQEKYDNMSEGMQESERGQSIMEAADALDAAASECGSIEGSIDDIINHLSEATGE